MGRTYMYKRSVSAIVKAGASEMPRKSLCWRGSAVLKKCRLRIWVECLSKTSCSLTSYNAERIDSCNLGLNIYPKLNKTNLLYFNRVLLYNISHKGLKGYLLSP